MIIFYWILFIFSGLMLLLIFLRRMRLTVQDLKFQANLAKEEKAQMEEDLQAPVQKKPHSSPRKNFLKADMHFSRKEWDDAERLFLAVIEMDSRHMEAHHKLGLLYMNMENFPKAELLFNKLINMKKDPIYYSNLGAALYQQNRLVEAAEAYENAIALDDKRGNRLQSLAQVYYELDEQDKALHYFERAERRKPKDIALKFILSDFYESLGEKDKAIAMLTRIIKLDPYNEEARMRLQSLQSNN